MCQQEIQHITHPTPATQMLDNNRLVRSDGLKFSILTSWTATHLDKLTHLLSGGGHRNVLYLEISLAQAFLTYHEKATRLLLTDFGLALDQTKYSSSNQVRRAAIWSMDRVGAEGSGRCPGKSRGRSIRGKGELGCGAAHAGAGTGGQRVPRMRDCRVSFNPRQVCFTHLGGNDCCSAGFQGPRRVSLSRTDNLQWGCGCGGCRCGRKL